MSFSSDNQESKWRPMTPTGDDEWITATAIQMLTDYGILPGTRSSLDCHPMMPFLERILRAAIARGERREREKPARFVTSDGHEYAVLDKRKDAP